MFSAPRTADSAATAPTFPWRKPSVSVLLCACLAVSACSLTYYSWHLFTEKHRPLVRGIDNNYYFFWLPSVLIDHDLDFTNQLTGSPTLSEEDRRAELAEPLTSTGHRYNKFPIGWALATAPWFEGAHLLSLACGWPTTGWEPPYQIAVWLGQLCYAWLGLWFAWRILAHFFAPLEASWAVLLAWLASPLIYYQTAGLSMTHSLVFSLVAMAVWLGIRISSDPRLRWFAALGFVSGLLLVTRYTAVIYLLIPDPWIWDTLRKNGSPAPVFTRIATLIAAALPPVFLQLLAWKIIYGSWFVYSYGDEGFHFSNPHLFDVLFSPKHGFFYWHPAMAAGIAGLLIWSLTSRQAWAWLTTFLLIWFINASWWCWWFGSSYGGRSFEGCVLLAMAGLAAFFTRSTPRVKTLLVAAGSGAAVWNILVLALFLTKHISADDPVTWAGILRALFNHSL